MSPFLIRFYFLLKKETKRFLKVFPQTVLAPIVNVTLYLFIFGVSIGERLELESDVPYLLFLLPGLLMMGMLNNSFQNASGSLMTSKFHGDLEDWRVAPLSCHHIVWGMSLACLARGWLVSLMIIATGGLFNYFNGSLSISILHPWWAFFFLCVGGLSFGMLGIVVGFFSKTFDQMNSFSQFILLPLIYLGGVFFSIKDLHSPWQTVAYFNPLLYFTNGLRRSVLGVSDIPLFTCAAISLVALGSCLILAYWAVLRGSYKKF